MEEIHNESQSTVQKMNSEPALTARERRVLDRVLSRERISRNINRDIDSEETRGQRIADLVARFGGSWTFIGIFVAVLMVWIVLNTAIVALGHKTFDPYPFIFLNLVLSMLAAIQAPIIMMSQNRASEKDRVSASHDYEVNLKAELEIMQLHEKIDEFRQRHLQDLMDAQGQQIKMLEQLLEANGIPIPESYAKPVPPQT